MNWQSWFAWRPVSLSHLYGSNPASAWLLPVSRARRGRRFVYALPGMELAAEARMKAAGQPAK